MNLRPQPTWSTALFNPFVYVAGGRALVLGVAAIVVAGLIGAIGQTHFDGVLDTHIGRPAPVAAFVGEGLIDWLSAALVLGVVGKMISQTSFRMIDVFGTQALARWPTVFSSLLTLPPAVRRFSHELLAQLTKGPAHIQLNIPDAAIFMAVTLALLPLLCWMVVLMYQAFAISCNVRGGKAIGAFIAGVIGAEILSKIAVMAMFRLF